jgi:hypothetical protein
MQFHFTMPPDWIGIVAVFVLVALGNIAYERWKERFRFLLRRNLSFISFSHI